MFKLRSMSGFLIMRSGGPIAWKSVRQERTSLSSCEAEVRATNECAKETLHLRLLLSDLGTNDATSPSPVYNDNHACVDWSKSTTTKGMKHVNLRDNCVREAVSLKELLVSHIAGKINPADLFTKELRDGSHFRRVRDSFMCPRPDSAAPAA